MDELRVFVTRAVGAYTPPRRMQQIPAEIQTFREASERSVRDAVPLEVPDAMRPTVVAALLHWRSEKADNLAGALAKVSDPSVVAHLAEELQTLDELVASDWVRGTEPGQVPQLVDFVSLEIAEREVRRGWEAEAREYDEKFHILQAPQMLVKDVSYFRSACAMRGASVAIAFVGIDDFKGFNTEVGETIVDIKVLPTLMRTMESVVFGRGYAYRQGGDEYVICLPNIDLDEATAVLDRLRQRIAELEFEGIDRRATVSIGVALLRPSTPDTIGEALAAAVAQKNEAKLNGKDTVCAVER